MWQWVGQSSEQHRYPVWPAASVSLSVAGHKVTMLSSSALSVQLLQTLLRCYIFLLNIGVFSFEKKIKNVSFWIGNFLDASLLRISKHAFHKNIKKEERDKKTILLRKETPPWLNTQRFYICLFNLNCYIVKFRITLNSEINANILFSFLPALINCFVVWLSIFIRSVVCAIAN